MPSINKSKKPDPQVQQVLDVLAEYKCRHPNAQIEARYGNSFIYTRVMDPDFEGMDDLEREQEVWPLLEQLPDEMYRRLGLLVLVTPEEAPHSGSSIEFDDPLSEEALSWQMAVTIDLSTHTEALNGAISVPLEAEEVEALEQVAQLEGVSHSALIRQWVQEKLTSLSLPSELAISAVAAD